MNWVKKYKLPAIEAIHYNGHPYIKLDDLWQALHMSKLKAVDSKLFLSSFHFYFSFSFLFNFYS